MACARTNEMVEESRAYELRFSQAVTLQPKQLPKQRIQWSGLGALLILISITSRFIYLMSRVA